MTHPDQDARRPAAEQVDEQTSVSENQPDTPERPRKSKKAPAFSENEVDFKAYLETIHKAAYEYYDHGFSIFRLKFRRKGVGKDEPWKTYRSKRILREDIPDLFSEPCGIGVACGSLSGITVLDVDGPTGWRHLHEDTGISYEDLKHLPHSRTPGKDLSYHFFFRWSPHHKNVNGATLKVDVRGEGGLIVLPPSQHEVNGACYEWVVPFTDKGSLEDMPSKLDDLCYKNKKPARGATEELDSSAEEPIFSAIPLHDDPRNMGTALFRILKDYWTPGQRHQLSLYLVGFLRKCQIPMEQTRAIIEQICELAGDYEVGDRITAISTTYSLPPREVKGKSGLDEILVFDDMLALRKLFAFSHYSPLHKVGYDRIGIYKRVKGKDDEPRNSYVIRGQVEFSHKKVVHQHNQDRGHYYVFTIDGREITVTAADMAEPRRRVYPMLQNNSISCLLEGVPVISDLVNSCVSSMDFPTYNYYTYMGWVGDDLVVPNLERKNNILEKPASFEGWNEVRGRADGLNECYSMKMCEAFPPLAITLGHTAISPFLYPMRKVRPRVRNGIAHLVGQAGQGKTSLARLAFSLFGDPELIKTHWHATVNSLEYQLRKNEIFPVFLDELSASSAKREAVEQFIYMVELGKGKGRLRWLKETGDADEVLKKGWCLNVVSTGEGSLKEGMMAGTDSRVLEFNVNCSAMSQVEQFINERMGYRPPPGGLALDPDVAGDVAHHGWFMRRLLERLEKDGGKGPLTDKLVSIFDKLTTELLKRNEKIQHPGIKPRLLTNFAQTGAGIALVHDIMGLEGECTIDWLADVIVASWDYLHYTGAASNDADHIYRTYVNFFYAKRDKFAVSAEQFFSNREIGYLGFYSQETLGEYFYLTSETSVLVNKEYGLKTTTIQIDQLLSRGKFVSNEEGRRTFRVRGGGLRFYKIRLTSREELEEPREEMSPPKAGGVQAKMLLG